MPGYGGSFSFRVICGSLVVRIDAASRPITIHRTAITPLGYIPARAHAASLLHLISPSPSLPLALFPACTRALFGASASPDFLPRPSSSLPALLQIARRTHPLPLPRHLRKIARDLNYCALLLSPRPSLALSLFLARGSNYHSLFPRPRFKLSREARMIIYRPRTNRIFRSPFLSQL